MSRKEKISQRISVLVDRKRNLENTPSQTHERSIREVGLLAIKDELTRLGREMGRD